ncbi:MAG: hypothetical protein ACYDEB_07980 [Dehalococcoidia bacterium]
MAQEQTKKAPYVAWKTFTSALQTLEDGLPDPLDASVWSSQSGSAQAALMRSFQFLGLIDSSKRVQPILRDLLKAAEPERKAIYKQLVQANYPKIVEMGTNGASPQQLEAALRELGVEGATLRKAKAFYLAVADYAGIPVSPHWGDRRKRPGPTLTTPRPKRARQRRKKPQPRPPAPPALGAGTATTVELRSGGSVRLSASVDLFTMSVDDRTWFLDLIDRVRAYKEANPETPTPATSGRDGLRREDDRQQQATAVKDGE